MSIRRAISPYRCTVPDTLDELNARIIEWCSREACKSYSSASQKYHLNGINQFCGTIYTRTSMDYIYTYLGNGINHDLCLRFVGEMDFNLNKLKRAIAQRRGQMMPPCPVTKEI